MIKSVLKPLLFGVAFLAAPLVVAEGAEGLHPTADAMQADVIFLGEQHDNPRHHAVQAAWVDALQPKAIVFEMLTEDQAARSTPKLRGTQDDLEATLGWEDAGWPDFAMYYPIFTAAPGAAIWGAAVPRDTVRRLMQPWRGQRRTR